MEFISLFSGIGGLDLGLERAGHVCIAQVEIDDYCQQVLQKHWPKVKKYRDIREFNTNSFDGKPQLICGGFPCQDISDAGKRKGITGSRSSLWKQFYRIICEFRPRFVLVENSSSLRRRGLPTVLGDLASVGYDSSWQCLPASAVGAPHIRERIFILAYPHHTRFRWRLPQSQGSEEAWQMDCWPSEPNLVRMAHGIPARLERIKGLGNAVLPAIGEMLGRILQANAERG